MTLTEIYLTPVAAVELTGSEIELLCECAATHYDGTCQAVARQGGFLYGVALYAEVAPGRPHRLTVQQLDMLVKLTEIGRYLGPTEANEALRPGAAAGHSSFGYCDP